MERRKLRRPLRWYLVWTFFSLFFLSTLIVAVINLPLWKIGKVEVSGTQILSPEEIKDLAEIPLGENLFLTDFSKTESKLQKVTAIKKFSVLRLPPGTVRINLKERTPVAVIMLEEGPAIIDNEGFILSRSGLSLSIPQQADLPVVSGIKLKQKIGIRLEETTALTISEIIGRLSNFYELKKLYLAFENEPNLGNKLAEEDISFLLEDLLRVRLGRKADLPRKMRIFSVLLQKLPPQKWNQVEYIDVRFVENPVIKYR